MPNLESPVVAPLPQAIAIDLEKVLAPTDVFVDRHLGPGAEEQRQMLEVLGYNSLAELIDQAVPPSIRLANPLKLPAPPSEYEAIAHLKTITTNNQV